MKTLLSLISFVLLAAIASAQPAAPPPELPGWTGSFAAGLALTQGNSDTSTVNLAYDTKRDTGTKWVFTSAGLFIRGEAEGVLTTNRLTFEAREDYKFTDRTSLFTKVDYLRDSFKAIDYLVSPTAGIAYLLVKNERTELGVNAGVGVVWEKDTGLELDTSGAVSAGQALKHKLTATTEVTEKFLALWKMDDFEDGLYTFGIGLAAAITSQTQLKAEFLDTYKNKPLVAGVQKNDVAVLLSFVYKY